MTQSLNDLLQLFDIKLPISEQDIKDAKKKVLLLHPDKNQHIHNIHDIFIKFKKSYETLEQVFYFTNKNYKHYNTDIDDTFKQFIDKHNIKNDEFLKHFNQMFENVYIHDDHNNNIIDKYTTLNHTTQTNKLRNLNDIIQERKNVINIMNENESNIYLNNITKKEQSDALNLAYQNNIYYEKVKKKQLEYNSKFLRLN